MRTFCFALLFSSFYVSLFCEEVKTKQSLFLKPKTILATGELKLSHLVTDWKGKDLIIKQNAAAPFELTSDELNDILLKEGSVDANIASFRSGKTIVLPMVEEWKASDLTTSLLSHLEANGPSLDGKFRFYSELPSLKMPKESVSFQWRRGSTRLHAGKRIFPLDLIWKGRVVHSLHIPFVIEEKKEAWFTVKEIEAKTVLQDTDVERKSFFTSDNRIEYEEESPIGKTALIALASGVPLQKKQTRSLHMVERGQEVQLVYTIGSLYLKIKTRALESGNEGDKILLLNLSSQSKIKGTVQSPGVCILSEV
ncbi:flagella basal body P-ring formation protein FlgA [Leptospira ryugenii]|uniref:Flagella basal body P-ring formation protein FlgA n=1 Tax=Leptospira ryugenii TaxID=1917863 RepID=A0A2P2DXC3_9LEPT|nr:flagellar basal body P-ring formation chaperone FlgA [Leptospira ryugenii]GBF49285.1 flagella basal body P-ring formation protein FlgA [Leptospira ryugenii]